MKGTLFRVQGEGGLLCLLVEFLFPASLPVILDEQSIEASVLQAWS